MAYIKKEGGRSSFGGPKKFGGPRTGGFKSGGFRKGPGSYAPRTGGFGAARPSGGAGFAERELFEATCAECNTSTQVPFRPNGRKPVFCRDCFKKQEGAGDFEERPRFDRAERTERPAYRSEAPRAEAPVVRVSTRTDAMLTEINTKLDRVIRELEALKGGAAVSAESEE